VLKRDVAVKVTSRTEVVTARLAEVSAVVAIAVAISIVVTAVTAIVPAVPVPARVVMAFIAPVMMASVAPMRAMSLMGTTVMARNRSVRTVISVPAVAAMRGASPCPAGSQQ
jgi:hypothetical protein